MTRHRLKESIPDFVFDNMDGLKEKREKLDISQEELAGKIGLSVAHVKSFEYAIKMPTREVYNRIAKVLDWRIWL